jgi:ATP-dependent DNA ligase
MPKDFKHQKGVDLIKVTKPLTWDKYWSVKLDGIRLSTQENRTWTTSLKEIPSLHVREMLSDPRCANLDGELIVGPPNASDVYSKTYSGVMTENAVVDFQLYAFDDLSHLDQDLETRLARLRDRNLPSFVVVLDQHEVFDEETLAKFYEAKVEEGFEGLVGRNKRSLYKFGRSTALSQDCIKMKPYRDDEARVLDIYEAMQNNNEAFINERGYTERSSHKENKSGKGMIGGFLVEDVITGVVFRISAGTLTHPEREEAFQNPQAWINSLVTYRHLTIGVKDKPRHGRYMRRRDPRI